MARKLLLLGELRDERESLSQPHVKATINKQFPPTSRLRKSAEFSRIKTTGLRLHSRHFLILVETRADNRKRLGITVSTKIDKKAVVRNRIKRLVRESYREFQSKLRAGFDIVVIARKNASELSMQEVCRELVRALSQKDLIDD